MKLCDLDEWLQEFQEQLSVEFVSRGCRTSHCKPAMAASGKALGRPKLVLERRLFVCARGPKRDKKSTSTTSAGTVCE